MRTRTDLNLMRGVWRLVLGCAAAWGAMAGGCVGDGASDPGAVPAPGGAPVSMGVTEPAAKGAAEAVGGALWQVVERRPIVGVVEPAKLRDAALAEANYERGDGGTEGGTRLRVRWVKGEEAGTWCEERYQPAGDETAGSLAFVRMGADGSFELVRSVERDEKVVTWFEPPMKIFPAGMRQGEVRTQTLRMVVRPSDKPEKVRMQGEATHEVTLLGEETVRVRGGTVKAVHIRGVLRASLGLPRVLEETDVWYVEGKGWVAEKAVEKVTTLGVKVRGGEEMWVRE